VEQLKSKKNNSGAKHLGPLFTCDGNSAPLRGAQNFRTRVCPPKAKRLRSPLYVRSIELPLLPKFKSQGDGVDFDRLPPSRLVAPPVKLTVVRTTERHRELVADLPTEGAGLSEAQMVRVARGAPAHEAGLACTEFPVFYREGGCPSAGPAVSPSKKGAGRAG